MNARSDCPVLPRVSLASGGVAPAVPNLAVLLAVAWALIVLQLLIRDWSATAVTLRDTDDAMRLVELRAFLAGHGWFDLHEARIAPPLGYDSHWSRLIDAGLAGLFLLFRPFADAAMAERLMRVVWPMLWLLPTMAGAVAVAYRLAGREGALVALLSTVIGLPAYSQFAPGRIDHHNVQIALAMLVLAATVWSDRARWAAVAAGLATGLAMAIGLECLPFLVICAAALGLRFVVDPAAGRPLAGYALSLALGTAFALAVDVPPARWTETACDMIAVNTAVPVVAGGVLLAITATLVARTNRMARLLALAAVAAAVAAGYVALEPRCLGGPYAMMDPAVWPIWLAHVDEMQSWIALARKSPDFAAVIVAFPAFVLAGAGVLVRDAALRRDFAFLVAVAGVAAAGALTLATVKMYNYAVWLAIPPGALVVVRLCDRLKIAGLIARGIAALLLTPGVLCVAVAAVVQAAPIGGAPGAADAREACFRTDSYAALARLPPGLVAADVDYGPFILALTPHTAIAGPYHRMSAAILATYRIFSSPPARARVELARLGAAYVALCGPASLPGLGAAARAASLGGRLAAGAVPGWLERLPESNGEAFTVYRVRQDR